MGLALRAWRTVLDSARAAADSSVAVRASQHLRLQRIFFAYSADVNAITRHALKIWYDTVRFEQATTERARDRAQALVTAGRVVWHALRRTVAITWLTWVRRTTASAARLIEVQLRSEKARNGLFSRLATSMHDPLRALKRLEHIGEWRSLRTWKAWTDAASAAEERRAVAATKALSTLCRVEGRFLRLGWRTWTLFCRASLKCERLCKRWTHAVEFRAMRSWALFVAAAKSQARAVSLAVKVLGRLRRADEFAAWRRWEAHPS